MQPPKALIPSLGTYPRESLSEAAAVGRPDGYLQPCGSPSWMVGYTRSLVEPRGLTPANGASTSGRPSAVAWLSLGRPLYRWGKVILPPLSLICLACAEVQTPFDGIQELPIDHTPADLSDELPPEGGEVPASCDNDEACPEGLSCCDGRCVSTLSDPANCGGCGQACSPYGNACIGGVCTCSGAARCSEPRHCCTAGCVDVSSSPNNCGACGRACPAGDICQAGSCVSASCDPPCQRGNSCCSGICTDTMTDPHNCGACGNVCPQEAVCEGGECRSSICDPPCPEGQVCCAGRCTDLLMDESNCGRCGIQCSTEIGPECREGRCMCGNMSCRGDLSSTCCSGRCANLTSETQNCGACDRPCNWGEICSAGTCMCGTGPGCPPGSFCCGGACVNTATDPQNCGICGRRCGANEICREGQCYCGADPGGCPPLNQCCPPAGPFIPAGCAKLNCTAACWCGGCDPERNWCLLGCIFGTCVTGP